MTPLQRFNAEDPLAKLMDRNPANEQTDNDPEKVGGTLLAKDASVEMQQEKIFNPSAISVDTNIKTHTWKWLPQTDEGKIKFDAVYKALTMFQSGTIKILHMWGNLKGKAAENLEVAGVTGSLAAFSVYSYYAFANFSEAVKILREGGENKYSNAAKKIAVGLAATGAGFLNLSYALVQLSKVTLIPAGTFVGTVVVAAVGGFAPLLLAVLEGDKLKLLRSQANAIRTELKELEAKLKSKENNTSTTIELDQLRKEIELKKIELDTNITKQRISGLKVAGALLYVTVQTGLAIGTMGGSIPIVMAINLGYSATVLLIDYSTQRRAEARKALSKAALEMA